MGNDATNGWRNATNARNDATNGWYDATRNDATGNDPPMDGGMMPPGMMPPMDGGMMPPMPGMIPPMPKETEIIAENKQGGFPGGKTEEQLYNEFMELMSKSTYKNPLEDPAIQKMMMANARPEEIEQIKQAQQMFDPKF